MRNIEEIKKDKRDSTESYKWLNKKPDVKKNSQTVSTLSIPGNTENSEFRKESANTDDTPLDNVIYKKSEDRNKFNSFSNTTNNLNNRLSNKTLYRSASDKLVLAFKNLSKPEKSRFIADYDEEEDLQENKNNIFLNEVVKEDKESPSTVNEVLEEDDNSKLQSLNANEESFLKNNTILEDNINVINSHEINTNKESKSKSILKAKSKDKKNVQFSITTQENSQTTSNMKSNNNISISNNYQQNIDKQDLNNNNTKKCQKAVHMVNNIPIYSNNQNLTTNNNQHFNPGILNNIPINYYNYGSMGTTPMNNYIYQNPYNQGYGNFVYNPLTNSYNINPQLVYQIPFNQFSPPNTIKNTYSPLINNYGTLTPINNQKNIHSNTNVNNYNLNPNLFNTIPPFNLREGIINNFEPSHKSDSPILKNSLLTINKNNSQSKKKENQGSSSSSKDSSPLKVAPVNNILSKVSKQRNSDDIVQGNTSSNLNELNSISICLNSLDEILQKNNEEFVDFLQSKIGSKTLQAIVSSIINNNKQIPDSLISKLSGIDVSSIIINKYGSFFFEKFIKFLSFEQRMVILNSENFKNNFVEMCCGKFSNMVIQSVMKSMVKNDVEEELLKNLIMKHLINLSSNQYANFALNQVFYNFKKENKKFIIDYVLDNLTIVSTSSRYGHYIVKNFIKYLDVNREAKDLKETDIQESKTELENLRQILITNAIKNLFFLVPHKFGHFVIVDLVEIWGVHYCKELVTIYVENIENFWKVVYGYAIAKRIFILNCEDNVSILNIICIFLFN